MRKVIIILIAVLASPLSYAVDKNEIRNTSIGDILSNFSKKTGSQMLVDPRVKAKVTAYSQNLDELSLEKLSEILALHGFTINHSGEFMVVRPQLDARSSSIPFVKKGEKYLPGEYVTDVIEVKKACASEIISPLRLLVPKYAGFVSINNANLIIVTDIYSNTIRIREIVESIDSKTKKKMKCNGPKNETLQ